MLFRSAQLHFLARCLLAPSKAMAVAAPPVAMDSIDRVIYTALPIAAARAVETDSYDSMIVDPLARKLMAGEDQLIRETRGFEGHMLKRTLIGDNLVKEAHENGTRQVVSLGAGMDSRAFRLGFYDMDFFEVDKAGLFEVKEPLVAGMPLQAASRQIVPCDLGTHSLRSALEKAGFNSSRPSCWLLEGLVMYLTRPEMERLAAEVGKLAAPGSILWHDAFSQTSVDRGMSFYGAPFKSGLDDYAEVWQKNGFSNAFVLESSGAWIDRRAKELKMTRRAEVTSAQIRGNAMCLLVRADKTR
eukprot:TRINITY_DN5812_c0_g1_i2.p1 TRINITY_DN5812_c0_g1~~TRINITY_DN5812_c0_g1_i2.p1  ORF type:complete len:300 (+),score=57.15 TRINITY_DN5812_c0_g1_i2:51-950(+)